MAAANSPNGGRHQGIGAILANLREAIADFERQLVQASCEQEERLQSEVANSRARQSALMAENGRLQALLRGQAAEQGAATSPPEEDSLQLRPPRGQRLLGGCGAIRRGASAPLKDMPAGPTIDLPADAALASKPPLELQLTDSTAATHSTARHVAISEGASTGSGPAVADEIGTPPSAGWRVHYVAKSDGGGKDPGHPTKSSGCDPGSRRGSVCSSTNKQVNYEVLPMWNVDSNNITRLASVASHNSTQRQRRRQQVMIAKKHSIKGSFGSMGWHRAATNPMSARRMIWETIGTVLVVYDLIFVPMEVSDLAPPRGTVVLAFSMTSSIYWTIDVPFSFSVGYYENGILEVSFRKIAKNYLRTWLIPDLVLVATDWILFALDRISEGDGHEPLSYLKASRGLRILRFVRLVRLLKLDCFFSRVTESLYSEYILTMLHVLKLVVMVVIVNHFVACGWYSLGKFFQGYHAKTWTDLKFEDFDTLNYRYATSMHWSLTQFTPASMEVTPTNTSERVYTICIIVLAMVVFSSFVSAITEAMTHMRKVNGKRIAQHSELRRYFSENGVPMQLALRIWRFLQQDINARQQRKLWRDVELAKDLPEVLQMDLQYEVFMPTLDRMPFFHRYNFHNPAAMRAICHKVISELSLVAEQELFNWGQVADRMYIVIEGTLEYVAASLDGGTEPVALGLPIMVTDRQWISEASIWIRWFYCGSMVAKKNSMMIALNVSKLQEILKQYLDTFQQCCSYGKLFVARANDVGGITDIWGDFDSIQAMAQEAFELDEQGGRRSSVSSTSSKESRDSRMSLRFELKRALFSQVERPSVQSSDEPDSFSPRLSCASYPSPRRDPDSPLGPPDKSKRAEDEDN